MHRDQEQGGRRPATNPAGNLHRPSLPSIRDVFPGQWSDDTVGGGRGMPAYPQAQLPPPAHQQAAPPYPQPPHPNYAARGPPAMYSNPPPLPRYPSSTPAPGTMQHQSSAHSPAPAQQAYSRHYQPHPPPAPSQYPPHPTSRPPAPPPSAPAPHFMRLERSASGQLHTTAASNDPRGLSSIHNIVAGQAGDEDEDAEGRHVCPICRRSFDRPSTLRTHMNAHTGLKPFSCPRCGRGFSASSNMRRHERKCRGGQGSSNDPQSPSSPSSTSS